MSRVTSNIRALTVDDVPAVLALHRRAFFPRLPDGAPMPGRVGDYYSAALLAGPWRSETVRPLVHEDASGGIDGFVGVIPRPMTFRGEPVVAAVLSSFMIDPDRGTPLIAAALLRRVLDGGQDLTFGNGANDRMRRLWESSGRRVVPHLSMRWWRLLRPAGFVAGRLSGGGAVSRAAGAAAAAAAPLIDGVATRLPGTPTRRHAAPNARPRPLDAGELVGFVDEAAATRALRPRYAPSEVEWLLRYLEDPAGGHAVRAFGVESGGRSIGWFVERPGVRGTAQILQAGAVRGRAVDVLRAASRHAFDRGAVTIQGRLDAATLGDVWELGAVLRPGPWFLIDSARPEIAAAVHAGDAFITSLETASMPADW